MEMKRWQVGILTVSDKGSKGERQDQSGFLLHELVRQNGGQVIAYTVVPDEQMAIQTFLKQFADEITCDLILTTGGTGISERDQTPEATKSILDKEIPGLPELMRTSTYIKTKYSSLSRATAGIRGKSLIINLPGSPKAVKECFDAIVEVLPHALELLNGKTEHAND